MAETDTLDFQQILADPNLTYEEGLRFFRGAGLMNETLQRLAADLDRYSISYCLIGAQALNRHGYRRFTADIDLLMTQEGLNRFNEELVGRGYLPTFRGSTKMFVATQENVPVEIIVSGEYPGDGRPKPVVFPDPATCSIEIDGVKTVTLEKLIELKLASGISDPGRLKDLADVQELIRTLGLGADFAVRLNEYVGPKYIELWNSVQ